MTKNLSMSFAVLTPGLDLRAVEDQLLVGCKAPLNRDGYTREQLHTSVMAGSLKDKAIGQKGYSGGPEQGSWSLANVTVAAWNTSPALVGTKSRRRGTDSCRPNPYPSRQKACIERQRRRTYMG